MGVIIKTIKARGLVLKEYETGEADKRLLLLCKGYGRLFVYARGARKPKSKLLACAQIFTYADYILAEGRGFRSVNQAEIIENFYDIRKDYDSLVAAHSITEVCEKSLLEDMPADELLQLALKALSLLSKGKFPALQVSSVFLIRCVSWYGFAPEVENCGVCVKPIDEMSKILFSAEGVTCADHEYDKMPPVPFIISKSAAFALRHIVLSDLSQSFSFKASESVISELHKIGRALWNRHFDRDLTG